MSRRFKLLFYKTLLHVPLAHTFDVVNFNSDNCKTMQNYVELLYTLFTDKTKHSLITPGINVGYVHSISTQIVYNIISPFMKYKFINRHKRNKRSMLPQLKAAFYTGALLRTITEPIRFVKLSYMVSKGSIPVDANAKVMQYNTVQELVDKTYINKGMKQFYIGLMPSLLAGGIGSVVDNAVFNIMQRMFIRSDSNRKMHLWQRFMFSTLSSSLSKVIVYPLEKANIAMITDNMKQTQTHKGYKDVFVRMYKKGIKECFSGIGLVLISNVICNGVDCMLRKKYQKRKHKKHHHHQQQQKENTMNVNINSIEKP